MGRKLHLGGVAADPQWEIFNAVPGPHVDHVGNAMDLSRFPDATFDELYGSHILEHFDYTSELQKALAEWRRVLVPGGVLYVSVPDLEILCHLFLSKQLTPHQHLVVMRMMFGEHVDQWDFHKVGFDAHILSGFLAGAGFTNIKRMKNFGIFNDTSTCLFGGVPISLNMIAFK